MLQITVSDHSEMLAHPPLPSRTANNKPRCSSVQIDANRLQTASYEKRLHGNTSYRGANPPRSCRRRASRHLQGLYRLIKLMELAFQLVRQSHWGWKEPEDPSICAMLFSALETGSRLPEVANVY